MELVEDLPADLIEAGNARDGDVPNFYESLNATKRDLLEKAFTKADGNYKEAARLLGLNPTYVYRLLKNLKLNHLLKSHNPSP